MTPETVQLLGNRVLIRVLDEDGVTASGLVIPDTAKEKGQRGEVVAVGDDGAIKVAVGDRVFFPKYSGTELNLGGRDHLILDVGDVLAVLRPAAVASAT